MLTVVLGAQASAPVSCPQHTTDRSNSEEHRKESRTVSSHWKEDSREGWWLVSPWLGFYVRLRCKQRASLYFITSSPGQGYPFLAFDCLCLGFSFSWGGLLISWNLCEVPSQETVPFQVGTLGFGHPLPRESAIPWGPVFDWPGRQLEARCSCQDT